MEGKLGKVYYSDKDFTDAEVAAQFRFPCVIRVRNVATRKIIKETHYDPSGVASIAYFGEGGGSVELDAVIAMGEITTTSSTVDVALHSSGSNQVRIGGLIYSKNTASNFSYTQVTGSNLKSLIIYALPTAQMLYLAEGNEGLEAVEPEIPAGALVVKKMIASRDGSWDVYDSLADAFIKKTTQAWRNRVFNDSETTFIVIDKGLYANFRIQSSAGISEINIGGINDRTNGALYDGLPMFLKNETNKPVNFLESYATPTQGRNITFVASQLPFVLQPGLTVELRYNPNNNKLDILKFNSAGGDDYANKQGSNIALPAFRDNLNIQVSATNLAKNSKGLVNSNSYWIRDVEVSKVLESGKTYTIKVWTKNVNQNTSAYFSIGDQTGHLVNLTKISPTEFVGKITMPRNSNGNLVLFRQPDDSSWYQFEAIKIVEGDMITKDWSPSPDDAAAISFATEGEVESNTPPSSENNKAISLFGLWKWWAKMKLEVLLKNFTEATTIATNGQLFSITGLSDKSADSTYYKILAQDSSGKVATVDNVSRRYDGTFNPPTQAQLTSLGIRRGDFYQNTTTNQRAMYNGNQLIEWTVTTAEYNALSTDQKNAVKNLSIIVI